jgi:hypothetical protein
MFPVSRAGESAREPPPLNLPERVGRTAQASGQGRAGLLPPGLTKIRVNPLNPRELLLSGLILVLKLT